VEKAADQHNATQHSTLSQHARCAHGAKCIFTVLAVAVSACAAAAGTRTGVGAGGLGVSGSLGPLLACRVLYGLGIGFAMHAAPAYIAETSPPSVRGLLISLKVRGAAHTADQLH
jgi:MFS family permease